MEYLPTALFGIIIGSIFDIFSRKNIMLYSLLMQSILILIIPLITVYKFPIWLILITIFFIGTFDLISWTGYQILISESVTTAELSDVSGKIGLISSIQKTVGPGISAVVVNLLNYLGGFILDFLSFLYLAITVKKLHIEQPTPNSKKKNIKRILSDGIKFLINQHEIKWMVLSFLAANIGFQLIIPMLTFILKQRMHVSIDKISLLFTISSIASIIGNFIYLRYGKKIKLGLQLIAIGLLITLGFILMLDLKSFWLFLIGYAIVSFGSVWAQANFFTIIQSRTPNKYKGMVTSTSTSLTRITGPFIAILSGIIIKVSYELLFSLAILCMLLSIGITLLSKLYKLDYLK
ncbi:hypothetical protein IMAU30115_02117 [Lactobacillus helveticus]|nr:hypothetical protein [Lactobacillus helveticus]NRN86220.1 hypothetical protein [Lactobacillus helveticus]NRO01016.1 hypothetical protein [Lactobacillus helveticus]NRO03117.1 hypothetical protein [Lactobacillus helveticus]NRO25460.1 hypothetical protein [Lactobacillus helveticus]